MIQPETRAGSARFNDARRELKNSAWKTDDEGVVHIPLRDGFEALIDKQDEHLARKFTWYLRVCFKKKKYYAETAITKGNEGICGKYPGLHRIILGLTDPKIHVDHKNGNGLDCRRNNIRHATPSQNASNRRYALGKSPYRGVIRKINRWGAQIEFEGRNKFLGSFMTPEEAAIRYNEEALRLFGEFAILNEVGDTDVRA